MRVLQKMWQSPAAISVMKLQQTLLAGLIFIGGTALPSLSQTDGFARVPTSKSAKSKTSDSSQNTPVKINLPRKNVSQTVSKKHLTRRDLREDFAEAVRIIKNFHIEGATKTSAKLEENAVRGTLRALDPHSNFFDSREYTELQAEHRSSFVGIGAPIAVFKRGNILETYITAIMPNSPASRAGLRFGDKIVAVDEKSCEEKNVFAVRDRIRGAKDTSVRLTIERASNGRIENFEIKRTEVSMPTLPDAYLLREDVGYIDLTEGFALTTADELGLALEALQNAGATRLILDLRGNAGGIVSQAVKAASYFLPKGKVILSQKGRDPFDSQIFRSDETHPYKMPLIVLVDGQTASAAEIVAGALQDHDRALIVGENTFGKGLVQSVIPLDDGEALTLTTARYFMPSGRSIQRDYENISYYEYFTAGNHSLNLNRNAVYTLTGGGRRVFGGNGITPDYNIGKEKAFLKEQAFADASFAFVRDLVNGRINGFENYRVTRPNLKGYRLSPNDLFVSEKMLEEFRRFARQNNFAESLTSSASAEKETAFKIRYFLAVANFGITTAQQINIEHDQQVLRALELFPQARQIANLSRPTFQNR